MTLDIFAQKLGDLNRPVMAVSASDEALGQTASTLVDCVQTVVDVMSDPKNGSGYKVSFAAGSSAFTSHKERIIVISAAPLLDAKVGTPLADIAAVITGFAVHEVGHSYHSITDAVRKEWPGKQVPSSLGNIIEDVVLEAGIVRRYAGFRDVFKPTFDWVAERTCPKFPIPWGTTSGERVNFIGQVVRYRDYVTFAQDEASVRELAWFDDWASRITYATTPKQAIALVREALARIHDHSADEPKGDEPEPPTTCPPNGPKGDKPGEGKDEGKDDTTDPGIPDDEDGEDEGEGKGKGEDEGEGNPGSGSDDEGEDEGQPGESDGSEDEGEGKGEGDPTDGTTQTADTSDEGRVEADKGTNDNDGAGGSGQAIAEVDPDDGFKPEDKPKSFDDAIRGDGTYDDNIVDAAITQERATVRLDAREHGKLRVVFHD